MGGRPRVTQRLLVIEQKLFLANPWRFSLGAQWVCGSSLDHRLVEENANASDRERSSAMVTHFPLLNFLSGTT
ncbi:hypothetical protein [Candidatus Methylacidithermus pantelleriae]|uniref:Uncharacterized protein n=1 Tax=Candidatus Methylacidithermus pantelleriae TaxID=2744239 RepID=A0A8J2BIU2_9BACT|nr:hypothetical protein [Candidatus Methylacidithermus pantelleriae]CAF0698537.1 hypothetical protein MPNT_280018 [Candidatus Methylacidithermus pantelleriae]